MNVAILNSERCLTTRLYGMACATFKKNCFVDTWQQQCFILSATKDTRIPDQEGSIALPSCNNKNPWRHLAMGAKQPRVMIEGGAD